MYVDSLQYSHQLLLVVGGGGGWGKPNPKNNYTGRKGGFCKEEGIIFFPFLI